MPVKYFQLQTLEIIQFMPTLLNKEITFTVLAHNLILEIVKYTDTFKHGLDESTKFCNDHTHPSTIVAGTGFVQR